MEQLLSDCLWRVQIPQAYDKVYKDECMFSFDTPLSEGGLFLNLSTFQSFGSDYVELDFERQSFPLYLHETQKRVGHTFGVVGFYLFIAKVPLSEEELKEFDKAPEKMAIGVEGGFQVDKARFKIEKSFELVILPEMQTIALPCDALPQKLNDAIAKIQVTERPSINCDRWCFRSIQVLQLRP